MEVSLTKSVDLGIKEEPGLSASASSSSRLSNLSSSSRRLRHISPPASRPGQKRELETAHRTSPRTTATQVYKIITGILFFSKWFCLGYFCLAIFDGVKHLASDWLDSRSLEGSPEAILLTLSIEHRLSKLSTLYPIPHALEPFVLGPRIQENTTAACLWADESDIPMIRELASSWSGPISLVITHSGPPSGVAHKELLSRLDSLSQSAPNISFHLHRTHSALRNSNAYINLARLFSPSSRVILFPPSVSTTPLPRLSAVLEDIAKRNEGDFIIPMLPLGPLNTSNLDISRNEWLPFSAMVLDRDHAPWCTERLFTIGDQRKMGKKERLVTSRTEFAFHWQECVWNVWLRSHGKIQILGDEGWTTSNTGSWKLPLQFGSRPETAEINLNMRLARRQRSETCFLVAREIVALGQWLTLEIPSAGSDEGQLQMKHKNENSLKRHPSETSQAKWFRKVCPETLERWGKELIYDV